jgi:hypothetical protein
MKHTRRRKRMLVVIGVIVTVIGLLMIWFNISYSPLKKQFNRDIGRLTEHNRLDTGSEVFTEKDFEHLPTALRRYVENSGYIGKRKMSYLKMEYKDVDFRTRKNGAKLKMDYTQYNFVKEPCRMAFDDAGMFGVPFQGYDYFEDGKGGMKGVLAKLITLFNETGEEMDRACLVTYLAESLFVPTALTSGYISFEQISEREVRGSITYKGQTVSGVFTFNDNYEMTSFVTTDRKDDKTTWTALCSDYKVSGDGIKLPTAFKAVWNFSDGDLVYFDGRIDAVSYGFE